LSHQGAIYNYETKLPKGKNTSNKDSKGSY